MFACMVARGWLAMSVYALRNVIAALGENPKLKVELLPRLGNEPLDKDLIRRVRHVQNLIEKYMRKRGVLTASRIFPVWPQEQHRAGESGGILIQVLSPIDTAIRLCLISYGILSLAY